MSELIRYSAALATVGLCNTGSAYFRSCCQRRHHLAGLGHLGRIDVGGDMSGSSPLGSARTSPRGLSTMERPEVLRKKTFRMPAALGGGEDEAAGLDGTRAQEGVPLSGPWRLAR